MQLVSNSALYLQVYDAALSSVCQAKRSGGLPSLFSNAAVACDSGNLEGAAAIAPLNKRHKSDQIAGGFCFAF